jgi:hypothetical protein
VAAPSAFEEFPGSAASIPNASGVSGGLVNMPAK